jgi:hypothetical protein
VNGDPDRQTHSSRRRWPWLALTALVCVPTPVAVAAWLASPSPTALQSHVQSRLQGTRGRALPLRAVAPALRQAVVATEDERFYRHHGIDLIGVLRAIPYDLVHLSFAQGASTITEQVGKLLYLGGNDHTPWRKLEDAALALKLEDRYSKEQILTAYLDRAYFGEGAYGVWAVLRRPAEPARQCASDSARLADPGALRLTWRSSRAQPRGSLPSPSPASSTRAAWQTRSRARA